MEPLTGTLGESSVQSGFARGVEGARALAAALAELPLQELQLDLGFNGIGPGPGEEKGPGPGPRRLGAGSLLQSFPQQLDTQKAVPP